MRHVDALSRCFNIKTNNGILFRHALTCDSNRRDNGILEQVKASQRQDEQCEMINELLKDGRQFKDYEVVSGVLYRFVEGVRLLVVPKAMQSQIIRIIHEKGHVGAQKVEAAVRQEYAIDGLLAKCHRVIANCVPCIIASRKAGRQEGLYNAIDKGDAPLQTYHVDHLGPLPSSAKNFKYIFVVVDSFTKLVWLFPVKDTSTAETLNRLQRLQDVFGLPRRIISDRGTAFTSGSFQEYCKEGKIEHVLITTGVPRGNGQVERINGIIIPALTKLSVADPL